MCKENQNKPDPELKERPKVLSGTDKIACSLEVVGQPEAADQGIV